MAAASSSSSSARLDCLRHRGALASAGADGGGGGRRRNECSFLSCAWKTPRALTGALASTTQGASAPPHWGAACRWLRCRDPGNRNGKRWLLFCSSSPSEHLDSISPDSLWQYLKPAISYLTSEELYLVRSALELAFKAHSGQKRRSGEPFITHPVEVARILGEHELDWESIAAGLLHDTVEDTDTVTFERIEKEFGSTVRHIVEGETKVSKLGKLRRQDDANSAQDVKAEDLRQMFLAMTEEVRVIIVKLADRLHNMRTLSHMPQHKQYAIAMETLMVFAPLAKLLGMYGIKSELEQLSFMYAKPVDFNELRKKVEDVYVSHRKELEEANKILRQKIDDDKFLDLMTIKAEIHTSCKELYSIHKSLLKSKSLIHEVNQVAQLRIILKPKACVGVVIPCTPQQICYHVLGLVHSIWNPVPQAVKDYIATPKPNGYQSLHTTVIPFLYESTFHLEVQIRTEDMDLIAEKGISAYYSGNAAARGSKGRAVGLKSTSFSQRIGWLNAIREWQEEFVGNMSSREFVDTITRDLLGSRVFVFTPKGEIKNLPNGSTVIDYAYLIHTEIGNKMVAAKVNGNHVPPTHVLSNAEVVEIITHDVQSGKSAYERHKRLLQHAKTRSARHKIMKFLREQAEGCAIEITADTVDRFVAEETNNVSDKALNVPLQPSISTPKINGVHTISVQKVGVKINCNDVIQNGSLAERIQPRNTTRQVVPSLESWRNEKIASWLNAEDNSIEWLCVVCVDRKGMMAEVTTALTAGGLSICSCVADVDQRRGMGFILFRYDGTYDNLVNACSSVDMINGVLNWSAGCCWTPLLSNHKLLEC